MKGKLRALTAVMLFALLIAACGGGNGSSNQASSQGVSVSLTPNSAVVATGESLQFTAEVQNASDQTVTWQVNGITGGSSSVGTISAVGLYAAPEKAPSLYVTVTAVSHADPTKFASAQVELWGRGTIQVSPSQVTVPAGGTQQFDHDRLQGGAENLYDWAVNGVNGGNATVGTISDLGLYTAPALPPPGGAVTITVTEFCLDDTCPSGEATATVVFSNSSLSGPYVFSFSGNDADGPVYIAGRFVADGNGTLEGLSDVQHVGSASAKELFTGTYTVKPDGHGALILSFESSHQTASCTLELTSTGGGPLLRFDNTANGAGEIYKQDSASFSDASLKGSYAFQSLATSSAGTLAEAGVFTSDGAGNVTAGLEDTNDGNQLASKVPITGSYSVDSIGRTVATIISSTGTGTNTSNLAMYLISSDHVVFVRTDGTGATGAGVAEKQQTSQFDNASLLGDYVYVSTGEPETEAKFSVGRFTADGAGTVSAGILDENDGGSVSQALSFSGDYSIPSTASGRGAVAFTTSEGTINLILYVVSDNKAFVVSADTSSVIGGQLVLQEPASDNAFQGSFAFLSHGFDTLGEIGLTGVFTGDSNGNLSGSEDYNDAGTLTSNIPITGTYSIGQDGRGQVTFTDGGSVMAFEVYLVGSSKAYLIGTDSSVVVFGATAKQY